MIVAPLARISDSGSVFRGLKEKALGNTSLMACRERFGIVYSFSRGVCVCARVFSFLLLLLTAQLPLSLVLEE